MANKYAALLLVVCLIAATIVDAQESLTPCLDHCVSDFCGEHPSNFCTILCNFGCTLRNGKDTCRSTRIILGRSTTILKEGSSTVGERL
ncbi:hypothetical protein PHAVU_007G059600 [Phaseolus vulgaris]|uniref:Uncharacterized protein n=1 Tax=Phaseolus vulgaris TaxID=3885 RepID=V7BCI5_PHAVU|nr:hypothetical protein PHAVU_007G059600g [Phaseolus vulgaris]ESW15280.1 hypothetical protein PHAVU_007G059600g [Phaseolus vulgaris]